MNTFIHWKLWPISTIFTKKLSNLLHNKCRSWIIKTHFHNYQSMIFRIKVGNLQYHWRCHYWLCNPFTLFLSLRFNISPFWIQTFHMGLNLTKQTKLDFVDFLWITLFLDRSAQMRWDKSHGIKDLIIVVKNKCYHDFNYGLVFCNIFDLIGAFLLTCTVE